jgi:hypothetical protein
MAASPKKLRLDRSRPHGTIHGERAPGDRHQLAHFTQDGITFDAQGFHIDELIEDDKTRALVDRRLKKVGAPKPDADDAGGSDDADNDPAPPGAGSAASTDVNLEAWLRGEEKYEWFLITKTVRERYSQNISKAVDMIEFLIEDMKVIPLSELAPEFAKHLKSKD